MSRKVWFCKLVVKLDFKLILKTSSNVCIAETASLNTSYTSTENNSLDGNLCIIQAFCSYWQRLLCYRKFLHGDEYGFFFFYDIFSLFRKTKYSRSNCLVKYFHRNSQQSEICTWFWFFVKSCLWLSCTIWWDIAYTWSYMFNWGRVCYWYFNE